MRSTLLMNQWFTQCKVPWESRANSHSRKQFKDFRSRFRVMFHKQYPKEKYREPGIFALQAYDAVRAVALGVKGESDWQRFPNLPNDAHMFSLSWQKLLNRILKSKFEGLRVVGDTAIVANHSRYAEFSKPYAAPGVQLLVPLKRRRPERAWLFKKPFTFRLWAARGEKLHSNLSRMTMVGWLFVALVITQSYTAGLTSLLTVRRLDPATVDIEMLRRIGAKVGCDGNSFVVKYLDEVLESQPHNIKKIFSEIDYPEALLRGDTAAAFLKVPYVEVFLAKYCNGFTTGQIFKVGGLGFVTFSLYM
ncbi:glutamate receptor [Citrus sinensis]|uniref:Glutamate receptor n=1 Tax=Citrus sinensis TaxID=2711 RepID=A0ACB8N1J4_CITSI|nr:glutamate receptor [Citrus sinensis]